MPSGFIVLPDGRCLSRRWWAHDAVVRAVANEVISPPLRLWLIEQLPGPDDIAEMGYGVWRRTSDQTTVVRKIDLRLLTSQNQSLLCQSAKRAARITRDEEWLKQSLQDLADMIEHMDRGEPPLSRSDWTEVPPPKDEHVGPG